MRSRTVASLLTDDPQIMDAIITRLERHVGIEPGDVLRAVEARLEGIRRTGHTVDSETVLWAVDASLDDLWSRWAGHLRPGLGAGEN